MNFESKSQSHKEAASKKYPWWAYALSGFVIFALIYGALQAIFNISESNTPPEATQAQDINQTQPIPTETATENSDEGMNELFNQMGSSDEAFVTTEYGHLQAVKQNDDTWLVTKIQNMFPEIAVETGVKTFSYNFIRDVYASDFAIRQAGVTINGTGGKYYRAFLGSNHAYKNDEWKSYGPTNFYNWMKDIETSRNESSRANETFIEENL